MFGGEKEILFSGGTVRTMDPDNPVAEAVAVKNGIIAAVGTTAYCRSFLGSLYEHKPLAGNTLLPGFIDTHMHPTVLIFFELNLDLYGVSSIEELKNRISTAAMLKKPGEWVIALNLDEQNFDIPALPNRHDLDEACPNHPVIILKHDGHSIFANTRALDIASVTVNTPDPAGGVIERDESGAPTGFLKESAVPLMLAAMPFPDEAVLREGAVSAFTKLAGYGITSLGTILQSGAEGPAGNAGAFDIPLMQMLSDYIPQHIRAYVTVSNIGTIDSLRGTSLHKPDSLPARSVGGIKLYADGTFSSSTAFMFEPFADAPGNRGFLVHDNEELYRCMEEAHIRDYQVLIHAIGDAANRTCADLYSRLMERHPSASSRHRVEHASQLDPQIIADFTRLGITASVQPMFIHSERNWLYRRLGRDRLKHTYPFRSMLEAGITLAGASDAPIESPDVLHALSCCVLREGFEIRESISIEQALRMYTSDAAFALCEEKVKGRLSPGMNADMVILSDDPFMVPAGKIKDIRIVHTMISGKPVYTA